MTLQPAEKQAEEDYRKSSADWSRWASNGRSWRNSSRTPEQEKLPGALRQLDEASKGLDDYYERLYVLFGEGKDANKQVANVKGDVAR